MAARSIVVTLGAASVDGAFASTGRTGPDPVAAAAAIPDATALSAAMAVLVADAASPTQAHVTTANNALTTYLAAATTYQAAVQASSAGNLTLTLDLAVLNTSNKIKSAIRGALQICKNYGIVL